MYSQLWRKSLACWDYRMNNCVWELGAGAEEGGQSRGQGRRMEGLASEGPQRILLGSMLSYPKSRGDH